MAAVAGSAMLFVSQHPDEDQYAWSAGYYRNLISKGDFSLRARSFQDPRWDPHSYWGRAMGTRYVYAIAAAVTGAKTPSIPYSFSDPSHQTSQTRMDRTSLLRLRLFGLLCAIGGSWLIGRRFGWSGAAAIVAILAIPEGWTDFARAWAEGPLLLGFGLTAVAWRTRWSPAAIGLASTFKLTAIGLWPLLLMRGAAGRMRRRFSILLALGVWTLFTPPSWGALGPLNVALLVHARVSEYQNTSATQSGLFAPSRYLWPFELVLVLAVAEAVKRRVAWRGKVRAIARSIRRPPGLKSTPAPES
jgi:hypothetical protein